MAVIIDGTSGVTAPGTTAATDISYTGTLTGGTGIVNLGSGQVYKDASGNVGVGTSSPTAKLEVAGSVSTQEINGRYFGFGTSGFSFDGTTVVNYGITHTRPGDGSFNTVLAGFSSIKLLTNQTERARIDSSGNLLVGTASAGGAKFKSFGNGGTIGASIDPSSSTATSLEIIVGANNTTQAGTYVYSTANSNFNFRVWSNGNTQNTNNSYGAISDIKIKENIVDATPKLDKLNQVRIVNYNLIGEEQKQLGVIAQELEQIFPGMIDESPDFDREGNDLETTTKSVKYSVFVPMLIKATQELKAIVDTQASAITTLNERITALEAK